MMANIILLQTGGAGAINILFMVAIFAVFYFFLIRPQAKKQKEQTKFADQLEKGSEVITASGIVGKINKIEGNFVTLQVDTKTFIKVAKSAISKEMTDLLSSSDEKSNKS
jgi:preprotein translocase subunit YajC